MVKFDDPPLRQRGRASLDFIGQLLKARAPLSEQIQRDLDDAGVGRDTLPDNIDAGIAMYEEALAESDAFGALELMADWHYRHYGAIATSSFEEVEHDLKPELDRLMSGTATLHLAKDFQAPNYWQGVDFHRTEGGWDGHPHMGYIHGELIHKKLVGLLAPNGIFKHRREAAERAPKSSYERILDMGCSSGHYTLMLAETYPDAEIVGVELSRRMLEHAFRTANYHGFDWKLHQASAEETGLEDASFDLVTSYILLHEMPGDAIKRTFAEAYRLLKSGGDMVMSDVPRYADMDRLAVIKADRDAKYGGEPHWRSAAQLDLIAAATDAGFDHTFTTGVFPHSVVARKA
ncbi:MAG: class I SAM-dependent methyltransferase [Pseudomonadota bacterium]